jgi:serine protease
MRWTVSALLLSSLVPLAGCDDPGPRGGDVVSGTVTVVTPPDVVLEAEPNDDMTQAQYVRPLIAGQSIKVLGHTSNSGNDPYDGFAFDAPVTPITVTATLQHDPAVDFDFFLFDPIAQTVLATYAAPTPPEVGTFTIAGPFHLVVYSYSGEDAYTLDVDVAGGGSSLAATAPSDARHLGPLFPDRTIEARGALDAGGKAFERFFVTVPYDALVEPVLAAPAGAHFEVVLRDVTLDRRFPLERARHASGGPASVPARFPASSLVEVEVWSNGGAGSYTLELAARSPADARPRGRIAPLAEEARLVPRARASYGRPAVRCAPGEALVLPSPATDLQRELQRAGARELARIPGGALKVRFDLDPNLDDEERQRLTFSAACGMNACGAFERVEPNLVRQCLDEPNDAHYNLQWHYEQIQLPAAWDLTVGGNSVVVAVIDSGKLDHPDLVGRTVPGYDLISDAANAGDGDGVDPDPTDEGDGEAFVRSTFHGTHVAGTVGAMTDNVNGVAGVTWMGAVQHVRVSGISGATSFDIVNGILYAAGLPAFGAPANPTPARVLNLSLGGPVSSQFEQDAVTAARNAGAVIVAASGNSYNSVLSYPASYQGVVSVAAVDLVASRAPYSTFNGMVDIAAPGGDVTVDRNGDGYPDGVLSTRADDLVSPLSYGYGFYQGTSMASPHVAGVAALMLSVAPNATPAQIENALFSSAKDLGTPGRDWSFGHGLVDAFAAVQAIQGTGGGGGGVAPQLSLSAQSLSFAAGSPVSRVQIANVGGSQLQVAPPVVTTQSGGNWLAASLVPVATASTTASAVDVRATAFGVSQGVYAGTVLVQSNGGDLTIQVSLTVTAIGPPDIDIYVLAVDVTTFDTAAQAVVNPTGVLSWQMLDLPPGDYLFVAGSDDDGDNVICGVGDFYCGIYPFLSEPEVLTKVQGVPMTALDFAVTTSFQGASLGQGGVRTFTRLQ